MENRISSIISTGGTISLLLDGVDHVIATDHLNYDKIKAALVSADADSLLTLVDIPKSIVAWGEGVIEVIDGKLVREGEEIHHSLGERALELMAGGFPFKPLLRFLENMLGNPSPDSIEQLYEFLEHKGLPITEDGCFLAYKGIMGDWRDRYSGTVDNSVGETITMERESVTADPSLTCSQGLHVGTLEYVRNYCDIRIIIVKVNPKDCVSVPLDHKAQKLRVCKYEVIREYANNTGTVLPQPIYANDGSDYDIDDDEYDDDESWDDCDDCGYGYGDIACDDCDNY